MKRIFSFVIFVILSVSIFIASTNLDKVQKIFNFASEKTTSFTLTASGFKAGEAVSTWVTFENGQSIGTPQVTASSKGAVTVIVTSKSNWPSGKIRVVAHGQTSKHEEYKDFSYTAPQMAQKTKSTQPGMTSCPGGKCTRQICDALQGEKFSGYRANANNGTGGCVDVTCNQACCWNHCACGGSKNPGCGAPEVTLVDVPNRSADELLNSGTVECENAKAKKASMGACAGSVAWGDCLNNGGNETSCRATAEQKYNANVGDATEEQRKFDAAMDGVKKAANTKKKNLTNEQVIAATEEVKKGASADSAIDKVTTQAPAKAPAPVNASKPPTIMPETGGNPPKQTYQSKCIGQSNPASCAGDEAWAACKLAKGTDLDCTSKANDAYNKTKDSLKKQGKWDTAYDIYDEALRYVRLQANISNKPVSDQVLVLATDCYLKKDKNCQTIEAAYKTADLFYNPPPAPKTVTQTITQPVVAKPTIDMTQLVNAQYQTQCQNNATFAQIAKPTSTTDATVECHYCGDKSQVSCKYIVEHECSKLITGGLSFSDSNSPYQKCLHSDEYKDLTADTFTVKISANNELVGLISAQKYVPQVVTSVKCQDTKNYIGIDQYGKSVSYTQGNCGANFCSMGECVSQEEGLRRATAYTVIAATNPIAVVTNQTTIEQKIKSGYNYSQQSGFYLPAEKIKYSPGCSGKQYYSLDGQDYNCSTGSVANQNEKSQLANERKNAQDFCNKNYKNTSDQSACLSQKTLEISAGGKIDPTTGAANSLNPVFSKTVVQDINSLCRLDNKCDPTNSNSLLAQAKSWCQQQNRNLERGQSYGEHFQYSIGGQTASGYCKRFDSTATPPTDFFNQTVAPGPTIAGNSSTIRYVFDSNTPDGVSNVLLKFLAGQSDAWSLGASLPDCSSTSQNVNSDSCKNFRTNLKTWMEQIGAPAGSIPGDCDGEKGTGWWTKSQCLELANFISVETNGGTRLTRSIYNPFQIGTNIGEYSVKKEDLIMSQVQNLAGGAISSTAIGGGAAAVFGGSVFLPVTGGLFIGTSIGDWTNTESKKRDALAIMGLSCGIDGSDPAKVSMNCNGDKQKEAQLADKIYQDTRNYVNPFTTKTINGFSSQAIIIATMKASGCQNSSNFDKCMDTDLAAYRHFGELSNEYARYLTTVQTGAQTVIRYNQEVDQAKIGTAMGIGFAILPVGGMKLPTSLGGRLVSEIPVAGTVIRTAETVASAPFKVIGYVGGNAVVRPTAWALGKIIPTEFKQAITNTVESNIARGGELIGNGGIARKIFPADAELASQHTVQPAAQPAAPAAVTAPAPAPAQSRPTFTQQVQQTATNIRQVAADIGDRFGKAFERPASTTAPGPAPAQSRPTFVQQAQQVTTSVRQAVADVGGQVNKIFKRPAGTPAAANTASSFTFADRILGKPSKLEAEAYQELRTSHADIAMVRDNQYLIDQSLKKAGYPDTEIPKARQRIQNMFNNEIEAQIRREYNNLVGPQGQLTTRLNQVTEAEFRKIQAEKVTDVAVVRSRIKQVVASEIDRWKASGQGLTKTAEEVATQLESRLQSVRGELINNQVARVYEQAPQSTAKVNPKLPGKNTVTSAVKETPGPATAAIGDIHGDITRAQEIIRDAGLIDNNGNWIGGQKKLVFTGDLTDRGTEGYDVIQWVRRLESQAAAQGGEVTVLAGNHDAIIVAISRAAADPNNSEMLNAVQTIAKGGHPADVINNLNRSDSEILLNFFNNGGQAQDVLSLIRDPSTIEWLSNRPLMALKDGDLYIHADGTTFYKNLGRTIDEVNSSARTAMQSKQGAYKIFYNMTDNRGLTEADASQLLAEYGGQRVVHGHSRASSNQIEISPSGRIVNIDTSLSSGYQRNNPSRGFLFQATEDSLAGQSAKFDLKPFATTPKMPQPVRLNSNITPQDLAESLTRIRSDLAGLADRFGNPNLAKSIEDFNPAAIATENFNKLRNLVFNEDGAIKVGGSSSPEIKIPEPQYLKSRMALSPENPNYIKMLSSWDEVLPDVAKSLERDLKNPKGLSTNEIIAKNVATAQKALESKGLSGPQIRIIDSDLNLAINDIAAQVSKGQTIQVSTTAITQDITGAVDLAGRPVSANTKANFTFSTDQNLSGTLSDGRNFRIAKEGFTDGNRKFIVVEVNGDPQLYYYSMSNKTWRRVYSYGEVELAGGAKQTFIYKPNPLSYSENLLDVPREIEKTLIKAESAGGIDFAKIDSQNLQSKTSQLGLIGDYDSANATFLRDIKNYNLDEWQPNGNGEFKTSNGRQFQNPTNIDFNKPSDIVFDQGSNVLKVYYEDEKYIYEFRFNPDAGNGDSRTILQQVNPNYLLAGSDKIGKPAYVDFVIYSKDPNVKLTKSPDFHNGGRVIKGDTANLPTYPDLYWEKISLDFEKSKVGQMLVKNGIPEQNLAKLEQQIKPKPVTPKTTTVQLNSGVDPLSGLESVARKLGLTSQADTIAAIRNAGGEEGLLPKAMNTLRERFFSRSSNPVTVSNVKSDLTAIPSGPFELSSGTKISEGIKQPTVGFSNGQYNQKYIAEADGHRVFITTNRYETEPLVFENLTYGRNLPGGQLLSEPIDLIKNPITGRTAIIERYYPNSITAREFLDSGKTIPPELMTKIASEWHHLNTAGYIHGDIVPEKILIILDSNGRPVDIKITDPIFASSPTVIKNLGAESLAQMRFYESDSLQISLSPKIQPVARPIDNVTTHRIEGNTKVTVRPNDYIQEKYGQTTIYQLPNDPFLAIAVDGQVYHVKNGVNIEIEPGSIIHIGIIDADTNRFVQTFGPAFKAEDAVFYLNKTFSIPAQKADLIMTRGPIFSGELLERAKIDVTPKTTIIDGISDMFNVRIFPDKLDTSSLIYNFPDAVSIAKIRKFTRAYHLNSSTASDFNSGIAEGRIVTATTDTGEIIAIGVINQDGTLIKVISAYSELGPKNIKVIESDMVNRAPKGPYAISQYTNINIAIPNDITQLAEIKQILRAKYNLPPEEMIIDDPRRYKQQIIDLIKSNNIEIVTFTEAPWLKDRKLSEEIASYLQQHPDTVGIFLNEPRRAIVYNSTQKPIEVASTLEHEYIHYLQQVKYPNMPAELTEAEAYVAMAHSQKLTNNLETSTKILRGIETSSVSYKQALGIIGKNPILRSNFTVVAETLETPLEFAQVAQSINANPMIVNSLVTIADTIDPITPSTTVQKLSTKIMNFLADERGSVTVGNPNQIAIAPTAIRNQLTNFYAQRLLYSLLRQNSEPIGKFLTSITESGLLNSTPIVSLIWNSASTAENLNIITPTATPTKTGTAPPTKTNTPIQSGQAPTKTATPTQTSNDLVTSSQEDLKKIDWKYLYYPVSQTNELPSEFKAGSGGVNITSFGNVKIANFMKNDLQALLTAAREYQPYVSSGYRTFADQQKLFNNNQQNYENAAEFSAKPGYSEHELGTAVDIFANNPEFDTTLEEGQADDPSLTIYDYYRSYTDVGVNKWLRDHAADYGFVISYPSNGSEGIGDAKEGSGYRSNEPWHLRYVGKEVAKTLMKHHYLDPNTDITVDGALQEIYSNTKY